MLQGCPVVLDNVQRLFVWHHDIQCQGNVVLVSPFVGFEVVHTYTLLSHTIYTHISQFTHKQSSLLLLFILKE